MNKPDGTKIEFNNRRLSERRSWIIYDLIIMVCWTIVKMFDKYDISITFV